MLARRRSKTTMRGERRSSARGQSVEFADHRNYVAGDDLRYLDWNLYGRLDRLFLKLYEEERELPVTLLLDASESMGFGVPRKFDFARQVVAAVGYVALCGFDRVRVSVFPGRAGMLDELGTGERALSQEAIATEALGSVRGRKSSLQFLKHLGLLEARGATDFNASLTRCAMETKQTGLLVVVSDFLDPAGYEAGLSALISRGFQVHAVQVLAPEEVNPSVFGDLRLVDSEHGTVQEVTFGRYRMEAYQSTVRNYVQRLREYCTGRGITFFQVVSDCSLEELLLKRLRESEVWG